MTAAPLRLRALDLDDLAVLSGAVEGARVRVADMTFERRRRRFAIAMTSFGGRPAGLHFEGVLKVATRGIDRARPEAEVELRAIGCEPGADADATVVLAFAGGGSVRLDVECIEAYLAEMPGSETP